VAQFGYAKTREQRGVTKKRPIIFTENPYKPSKHKGLKAFLVTPKKWRRQENKTRINTGFLKKLRHPTKPVNSRA
jgi:hypothetical protein